MALTRPAEKRLILVFFRVFQKPKKQALDNADCLNQNADFRSK